MTSNHLCSQWNYRLLNEKIYTECARGQILGAFLEAWSRPAPRASELVSSQLNVEGVSRWVVIPALLLLDSGSRPAAPYRVRGRLAQNDEQVLRSSFDTEYWKDSYSCRDSGVESLVGWKLG